MVTSDEQFVEELAKLITLAVAHTDRLQDPPQCDCSDRLARSGAFRQELADYSDAMREVLSEAFGMLRVRAVSYEGQSVEGVVH